MDARTGLGRFRNFRISNHDLMMELIAYCRNHAIEEILNLPDVKERVDLYMEHREKAKEQINVARPLSITCCSRSSQRGNNLSDQPIHDLRSLSGREYFHSRHVGLE